MTDTTTTKTSWTTPLKWGFWIVIGALLAIVLWTVLWIFVPRVIVELGNALRALPFAWQAPGPIGGWVNQGKHSLCDGRPKGVKFTCTSPTSGRQVECTCD